MSRYRCGCDPDHEIYCLEGQRLRDTQRQLGEIEDEIRAKEGYVSTPAYRKALAVFGLHLSENQIRG